MHTCSLQPSRMLPAALIALGLLATLTLSPVILLAQAAPLRTWPVTTRGDEGANVRALQYLLLAHGYSLPIDGIFGRTTEKALRQFQRAHRLVAGGQTNNPTWESLLVPLRQGSKGPAVKAAQIELRNEGYAVAVDSVFGPHMKDAVQKLQSRTGHTADGIVGRYTWYELVGGNGPASESD